MAGVGSYTGKIITSKALQAPTLSIDYSNLTQNNHNNASNNQISSSKSVEADLNEFLNDFEDKNENNVTNMAFTTGSVEGSLGIEEAELPKEKAWYEKLWDGVKETGATIAVGATSVISGIADIGEGLVDGLAWTGGKVVEGASWLVGETAGIFSEDAKEDVMSWRENFKDNEHDFIATDWVGEANKALYENTSIGRAINEASAMKYDSNLAQGISNVSEMAGKVVIATAATVVTGGAAAPIAAGFLFGVGDKAEKVYQSGETGAKEELGIFVSGLGEAANWYALGKLGQGATQLAGVVKTNGLKATTSTVVNGVKTTINTIKTNGVVNTAKDVFHATKGILSNTSCKSLITADNLSDSIGIIGDNASRWLTGEEEFNLNTAAKAGGELLLAWGLNSFFDSATRYLEGGSPTPSSATPTAPRTYKCYTSYDDFTKAYHKATEKWHSSLSQTEIEYFYHYTGEFWADAGNYKSVNGLLRNTLVDTQNNCIHSVGTGGYDQIVTFDELKNTYNMTIEEFVNMQTDAALALNEAIGRSGLISDTVLFRGMNYDSLRAYGINAGDSASDIFAKLTQYGDTFSDNGFMSCAPNLDAYITNSKPIILQMNCKQGLAAADLSLLNANEREVLLGMGTEFYIDGVFEQNGQIIINLTSK